MPVNSRDDPDREITRSPGFIEIPVMLAEPSPESAPDDSSLDADRYGSDADRYGSATGDSEREPAAPVEPESTRPVNEHEVTDAIGTVENVIWGMTIDTMPSGATRYTLPDDQDAHMQNWLAATAMDAAEQSTQEAGPGNGVDRLRAIRGILSLALAHVGEAIQTLEPDAEQVGIATSASGIEHEMRLGASAPRTPDDDAPLRLADVLRVIRHARTGSDAMADVIDLAEKGTR